MLWLVLHHLLVQLLLSEVANNCCDIATDKYGCCVIKKCVDFAGGNQRKLLLDTITNQALYLSVNYYGFVSLYLLCDSLPLTWCCLCWSFSFFFGPILFPCSNYVVQHILKLKIPGVTASLISQFEGRFSILSCDKYASNVVESCLTESGKDQFFIIVDELLRDQNYMAVFLDPYGNYVFTSAVEVSKVSTSKKTRSVLFSSLFPRVSDWI